MSELGFLRYSADLASPSFVDAYDELPLWSAAFGQLLLEEVPLANVRAALDVGCGTGFPLIELAERLGPGVVVHGVDTWSAGLERCRRKVAVRATTNARAVEADAAKMPFADGTFDLIVSNLGLNNFSDAAMAMRECRRVARDGAVLALTTNLQGHMKEFYDAFGDVLAKQESDEALRRLREHVAHRGTIDRVTTLLESARFVPTRVAERSLTMRFGSAAALFNHHFIKLGFLGAWKDVARDETEAVFGALMRELDRIAATAGELRLTVPMAYVEAVAQ